MPYIKDLLMVALMLLPTAWTTPLSTDTVMAGTIEASTLDKRRQQISMNIYTCNACVVVDEEGNIDCEDAIYAHNEKTSNSGFHASCNDPSIPMDDDWCSTYGQIPTPFGYGNWQSNSDCSKSTPQYTIAGLIHSATNDGKDWACSCYAVDGNFNEQCVEYYVCQRIWGCFCDKPPLDVQQ